MNKNVSLYVTVYVCLKAPGETAEQSKKGAPYM